MGHKLLLLCMLMALGNAWLMAQETSFTHEWEGKGFLRHSLIIQNETRLSFQQLSIGQEYTLVLKSEEPYDVKPVENISLRKDTYPQTNTQRIRFKATAQQHTFILQASIAENQHFWLSFFDQNQPEMAASASAMGLQTTSNTDPEFLIKEVLIGGDCFDVSSFSLDSRSRSAGTFASGMESIGIDEGVILATGNVAIAQGANTNTAAGTDDGAGGDPDLSQLVAELFGGTNQPIFDATILEFEFTPTVDSLSFEYVFASEEYCDYVNSSFNDVFGFFISGPGINGNFSNNAENVALVPGTGDYVSINTVNIQSNAAYYQDNVPPGQMQQAGGCTTEPNDADPANGLTQYDGFTVPLVASIEVIPCETYTIKLAVADVGDGFFDSAVMLKAGSFAAGGDALLDVQTDEDGNIVFEKCSEGGIIVRRGNSRDLSEPLVVNISIDTNSTATVGEDYAPFDTVITIPAGQLSVFIPIEVYEDLLVEGTENIIVNLDNSCSCEVESTEIIIRDVPPLESNLMDDTVCALTPVFLEPSPNNGPNVRYRWSDGQNGSVIAVYPNEDITYTVRLSNVCDELFDTVSLTVVEEPIAIFDLDTAICQGDLENTQFPIRLQGQGPFTIYYKINGRNYFVFDHPDSIFYIPSDQIDTGLIELTSVTGYLGCDGEVIDPGRIRLIDPQIDLEVVDATCGGQIDGSISVTSFELDSPLIYEWSTGDTEPVLDSIPQGNYSLTLTDANGCMYELDATVDEIASIDVSLELREVPDCDSDTGVVAFMADPTAYDSLRWSNGSQDTLLDNLLPGWYSVEVFTPDGCSRIDSIEVPSPPLPPRADILNLQGINCSNDTAQIEISISGREPIDILWSTGDTTEMIQTTVTDAITLSLVDSIGCSWDTTFIIPIDTLSPELLFPDEATLRCDGEPLIIDASANGGATHILYSWTTQNGNIDSTNAAWLQTSSIGRYTLNALDTINGCSAQKSVDIDPAEPPTFSIPALDSLTCNRDSVQVTLQNTTSTQIYIWLNDAGDTLRSGSMHTLSLASSGSYSVKLLDTLTQCATSESFEVEEDIATPNLSRPSDLVLSCSDSVVSAQWEVLEQGSFQYLLQRSGMTLDSGAVPMNRLVSLDFSAAGTYELDLINLRNGCIGSDTIEVSTDQNVPTINLLDPAPLTCTDTIQFISAQGSSSGPQFIYEWVGPGGNDLSGQGGNTIEVGEGGLYTLRITDTINGCSNEASINLEWDTLPPLVSIPEPATLTCGRRSVSLTATGNPNGQYTWTSDQAGFSASGSNITVTADDGLSYTVTIIDPSNGCRSQAQTQLMLDTVAPQVSLSITRPLPCEGGSALIQASGSADSPSYEWRSNNTILGSADSLRVINAGTYSLLYTDLSNGCATQSSIEVSTNEPVEAMITAIQPDCQELTGTLSIESVSEGTPPFEYALNDSDFGREDQFSGLEQGVYTLTVKDALGCTLVTTATIETFEELEVSIQRDLELEYGSAQPIVITTNRDPQEISVIEWTPTQGLSCTNCLNPTLTALESGTYTLHVIDIYGCEETITFRLSVDFVPEIYLPNVFTPNSDNINDWFYPSTNEVVRSISSMVIFDRWGNKLFERQDFPPNSPTDGWDGSFKGRVMDPGVFVYVISLELADGTTLQRTGDITLTQ